MALRTTSPQSPLILSVIALAALLSACGNGDEAPTTAPTPPTTTEPTEPVTPQEPPQVSGAWSTGDLHIHTYQSDDAQVSLEHVLDSAFDRYNLDWGFISNHLRLSKRDHTGIELANGPIAFSKGMAEYEVPFIRQAQEQGKYAGKTIFSSFEWDMPTHDHVNIGIGLNTPFSKESLDAVAEFEYLFTNRDAALFDSSLTERLANTPRAYSTHEDAVKAIAWLRDQHPDSYMLLNHPSRYMNKYTISQIREMNDAAPNIFFAIEGMVGNQMEPDRGGYATEYTDENLPSRTYGGVDYLVAKVGGAWDALLGEGRKIWTVANSDYHFQTQRGLYSSGYAPGEYAKTYLFKDGNSPADILEGLRSGNIFGVFGDLINALDFNAASGEKTASMGQEITVNQGDEVTISIRFRSPERNNFEYPIGSGNPTYVRPTVDHVDLIVGDIQTKAEPNTPAYANAQNVTAHVAERFTNQDWTVDQEDGYNKITYTFRAERSQYLRLRGTNLGTDVAGETQNGEPLADAKVTIEENQARFDAINARNYNDLWFYSNPIFVNVK